MIFRTPIVSSLKLRPRYRRTILWWGKALMSRSRRLGRGKWGT